MNEALLRDILIGGAGVLVLGMLLRGARRGRAVPLSIQLQTLAGFFLVMVARVAEIVFVVDAPWMIVLHEIGGYVLGFGILTIGLVRWMNHAPVAHRPAERAPGGELATPVAAKEAETVIAGTNRVSADDLLISLLQSSLSGVMLLEPVHDDDGYVIDFVVCRLNQAGEQIVGRSASYLVGKKVLEEFPCLRHEEIMGSMVAVLDSGLPYEAERQLTRINRSRAWYQFVAVKIAGGLLVNFADISARKEAAEQLKHAAQHDALTALPNRAYFVERVQLALSRTRRYAEERFAVLFLDFDRFKLINDSLGHEAGDQLLKNIADRLRMNLRAVDASARSTFGGEMPARLGGDEFVVLLEKIQSVHDAVAVAERLQEALREPYDLGGHEVISTASIGIVVSRPEYTSADDVLRDADTAMYRAKMAGKACYVVFDESMHEEAVDRAGLEQELRAAIENESFRVLYSPIVRLESNEIAGFEALVRWEHAERGLITAGEFVPPAEELGLMAQIGAWVFRQACLEWKQWEPLIGDPTNVSMNINLSRQQLQHPDFIPGIDRVLAETGMDGANIRLDITECMVVAQRHGFLREFDALRERGINLVLDDFGTGQSSFSSLQAAPIDMVKIDGDFIREMIGDDHRLAIVRSILDLAHTLGLEVVAEGVETQEQADLLRELGCDFAQGHLYRGPVNAAEVSERLDGDSGDEESLGQAA